LIHCRRLALWAVAITSAFGAAGDGRVVASRCRRVFLPGAESRYMGRVEWQDTSTGGIVGATEDRTTGQSLLLCRVKLPAGTRSAVLDFSGARVSFTGRQDDSQPNGLDISAFAGKIDSPESAESVCTLPALRTSRETWIELGPARYALSFGRAVDQLTVILRLVDQSSAAATRADIGNIKIRAEPPGETLRDCPPRPSPPVAPGPG
jgi:hypothetical protein